MKKIVLIQSLVLLTAFAGAADYNYSVQMKESDGTVRNMGDVQINVNQEALGTPRLVNAENNTNVQLISKIQNYIKSTYQGYNVTLKVSEGVVYLHGIVSSEQDKKNIEAAILKMDGVKKVDNQIKVGTFNGTNSI